MHRVLLFLMFLSCSTVYAQSTSTLSGYITDGTSGESVIGAKIYIPAIQEPLQTPMDFIH